MTSETRSYVALDCIYHPNLGAMQYGAFFNLCRLLDSPLSPFSHQNQPLIALKLVEQHHRPSTIPDSDVALGVDVAQDRAPYYHRHILLNSLDVVQVLCEIDEKVNY